MEFIVLEEFSVFTLNCEENILGEFEFGVFEEFTRESTWGLGGGGALCVFYACIWGNLRELSCGVNGWT
jgi:hypothetical protein